MGSAELSAAACRQSDPQMFDSVRLLDHMRARAVCATCPMVQACISEAVRVARKHPTNPDRRGPDGTWGGLLWRSGTVTDPRRLNTQAAA